MTAERSLPGVLTAYKPFLGREVNESQASVQLATAQGVLPEGWRTEFWWAQLPDLAPGVERVLAHSPRVWLAVGEARSEGIPELETVARNCWDVEKDPEAACGGPLQGRYEPEGPDFVRAHWPTDALAGHLRGAGFEVALSQDAGAHCCNGLLWLATRAAARRQGPRPWIGFLHLPRRPEDREKHAALIGTACAWLQSQQR